MKNCEKPTSRKTLAVLSILTGLLIALIVSEISLRLIVRYELFGNANAFTEFMRDLPRVPTRSWRKKIYRESADPVLRYELNPGASHGIMRINSHGFRGPEVDPSPPADTMRIIFLGDSEMYAKRLSEEENLAGVVTEILNNSGSAKFQGLNFGVPGYNTLQQWQVLKTRAINFKPSAVVLYYNLNDPSIKRRTILMHESVVSKSYLYSMLEWLTRYSNIEKPESDKSPEKIAAYYQTLHSPRYFEVAKNTLLEMGDYLSQRKIPLFLVIAPEIYGFENFNDYPYHNIHDILKNLSSENFEVIDPFDALVSLGQTPGQLWVEVRDPHKNALANRAIGEVVAKRIIEKLELF